MISAVAFKRKDTPKILSDKVLYNSKGAGVAIRYYKQFLDRLTGSSFRNFDGNIANFTQ